MFDPPPRVIREVRLGAESSSPKRVGDADFAVKSAVVDLLAELAAVSAFPEVGGRNGEAEQGGIRFRWEETVSGTPNRNFRRVEVRVSATRKPDYIVARLVGHVRRAE